MKYVLVTGGNFLNQGAFLMLVAAGNGVREYLGAQPVIPIRFGSEREKRWIGYDTLLAEERFGIFPRIGAARVMGRVRQRLPFVTASDVSAVVDVSGFAFGDQWVSSPLMRRAKNYKMWSERNIPVYMLPQAFGPFEKTADAARLAVQSSSLVYARDPDSLAYLRMLDVADAPIKRFPDFTGAVRAQFPIGFERLRYGAAIVPNWNILERAPDQGARERYVQNLRDIVVQLKLADVTVFGLCHEGDRDLAILQDVASCVSEFPIVTDLNGMELKGLLGACRVVISGRYHALIGALSQGVPAVLQGWSHKYRWLAADYDVPELVLDPYSASGALGSLVSELMESSEVEARIRDASARVKLANVQMWEELQADFLGATGVSAAPGEIR